MDEMLEGFRGRCSFRQYIPSKPNKYGIKIQALVDSRTFYTSKMEVYVGTQPDGPYKCENNPASVVKKLIAPITKTGRNITLDKGSHTRNDLSTDRSTDRLVDLSSNISTPHTNRFVYQLIVSESPQYSTECEVLMLCFRRLYLLICTMSELLERKRKSLIVAALVLAVDDEDKQRKKRKWSKQWLLERRQYSHMNLLRELQSNEPADFKNYLRMENDTFYELLDLVRPLIEKQNTIMRESISAEERLVATLQFLATGRSFEDLKFSCAISAQALGKIIPETCRAIYSVLRPEYLKVSKNL